MFGRWSAARGKIQLRKVNKNNSLKKLIQALSKSQANLMSNIPAAALIPQLKENIKKSILCKLIAPLKTKSKTKLLLLNCQSNHKVLCLEETDVGA